MVKEMADKVLCVTEQEVREDMHMMAPAVCALCDTVQLFMDAYQAEKLRRGVVDFNDLEHFAVQLLVDENDAPTQLAREMHFSEIMVDEYQDTNAVQDTIFCAVSDDEKNIFMVGDVKQSIYRFQLYDPDIFLHKYRPIGTQKPYPMMRRGAWCFPKISVPALRCWTASIICFLP